MFKLKTNKTINAFLFLLIGIAVPFILANTTLDASKNRTHQSDYFEVAPPKVPQEATFAGEKIDLRSYDRRERMDRELLAFTYMHTNSILMLKRANRYFPQVEPILKEEGIPDDFKYLMAIESSLNPLAKSGAGAAGLWQLMPQTAKELGLEVNDLVDERYDVEKSTRAACKYLKKAYAKYKDWMLVSASYNAGQARISTLMNKQKVEHGMDLWLVDETSRYMFRLLAAKEMFKSPQSFGFKLRGDELYPIIPYKSETTNNPIQNLTDFAISRGITYARLREANPWLRGYSLPNKTGKKYIIRIPTDYGSNYDPTKIKIHDTNWIID